MHKTQTAYAAAKALVDTIEAEYKAKRPVCPSGDDDVAFDAYCDATEKLRLELGYYVAKDTLWAAEEALVAWATSRPKLQKMAVGVIDLAETVKGARKSLKMWDRLVDICFMYNGR